MRRVSCKTPRRSDPSTLMTLLGVPPRSGSPMASPVQTRFSRGYVNFVADAARVYRVEVDPQREVRRTSHRVRAKYNIGPQAGSSSHCFDASGRLQGSAWAAPGVADEQMSKDIRAGSGSTAAESGALIRSALTALPDSRMNTLVWQPHLSSHPRNQQARRPPIRDDRWLLLGPSQPTKQSGARSRSGDDAEAAACRGHACVRASPEAVMTEEIVARD